MKKQIGHGYAIVRFDEPVFGDYNINPSSIVVKEIVWSKEDAESEVNRLNKLNKNKAVFYFWTITRIMPYNQ